MSAGRGGVMASVGVRFITRYLPTVKKQGMNKKWNGAIKFQGLLVICFLQQGFPLMKVPQPSGTAPPAGNKWSHT